MTIFNSLGSNYQFSNVISALFASNKKSHKETLQKFLEEKYQGNAVLVYKGREAIRLALRSVNLKAKTVAICGYTCFAVYDAIVKEGFAVEYLDVEKETLHFSFETLKRAVENNPEIKVVMVQNTLGIPCDSERIAAYCKEKGIIFIEDLAHAIGTVYDNGKEAGSIGDFVVLSFSQDKVIDGVSGGALIIRNKKFKIEDTQYQVVNKKRQIIDRCYPFFTYLIRKTYLFGIGKGIHHFFKKVNLLSNPMSDSGNIHILPNWYCKIIYREFRQLQKQFSHRERLARIYFSLLPKQTVLFDKKVIQQSSNLRFPILVQDRDAIITFLKKHSLFVSDIWYDSPIAPKKYMHLTDYRGTCETANLVSSQMLNLPTHRNVSETDAKQIAKLINQWIITSS